MHSLVVGTISFNSTIQYYFQLCMLNNWLHQQFTQKQVWVRRAEARQAGSERVNNNVWGNSLCCCIIYSETLFYNQIILSSSLLEFSVFPHQAETKQPNHWTRPEKHPTHAFTCTAPTLKDLPKQQPLFYYPNTVSTVKLLVHSSSSR